MKKFHANLKEHTTEITNFEKRAKNHSRTKKIVTCKEES